MKGLLSQILDSVPDLQEEVCGYRTVSGGDINENYRLDTCRGRHFFLKLNKAGFEDMFEQEAYSLRMLASTHTFRIPVVLGTGTVGDKSFLLMEYIEASYGKASPGKAGEKLAELHRVTKDFHGWESDNYIGVLKQKNDPAAGWKEFYIERRLRPMVERAFAHSLLDAFWRDKAEEYFAEFRREFPDAEPSLLHGDLWSGNHFYDVEGFPVLVDPASYYGNREMDIAMMHLFGGFEAGVMEAYRWHFPMEVGWKQRISHYQLYPLLVHLNLFGGSYAASVHRILSAFD